MNSTPPDERGPWVDDPFPEPDPDEPPPVELWSAVGDVAPWGTMALLLSWGAVFAWFAVRGEFGDRGALIAWGGNLPGRDALETAWRLLASTFLHSGAAHVFFNATSTLCADEGHVANKQLIFGGEVAWDGTCP